MKSSLVVLSLVLAITTVLSCNKTENGGGVTGLERTWKLTQIATDDNKNGAIDDYEKHNVATDVNDQLKFNSDGSGYQTVVEAGSPVVYNFTWTYEAPTINRVSFKHDTIHYTVISVSDSRLEIHSTIDTVLAGYVYRAL